MAGKYLDLEIKWLREDLDILSKDLREDLDILSKDLREDLDSLREYLDIEFEYLGKDLEWLEKNLEWLSEDIAQIKDLVGIERKDYLTEEEYRERYIKRMKNSCDEDDKLLAEELEKEIKEFKEQNKPH